MKIIAATCVVATALCTVVYHLFNTAGARIKFNDTSAHEALIAHVYVLTSARTPPRPGPEKRRSEHTSKACPTLKCTPIHAI